MDVVVKGQLEQQAKDYWLRRQRQAATPPHFNLVQDPTAPIVTSQTPLSPQLVPLRVDVETDGCKLREAFLWRPEQSGDPQDMQSSAHRIAMTLCDDFDLDRVAFGPAIQQSIAEQLQDHQAFTEARKGVSFAGVKAFVVVDVLIGAIHLQDRLLVDVGSEQPVLMAVGERVAFEAQLPAEFGPAVSFALVEQQYQLQRALLATGFTIVDGVVVLNGTADVELTQRLVNYGQANYGQRLAGKQTQTDQAIYHLTAGDLEKLEQIRDREGRRKRRQTRSRRDAWALSSPPKLHRTALTYKGRQQLALFSHNDAASTASTTTSLSPSPSDPSDDDGPRGSGHSDHERRGTLMMHQQRRPSLRGVGKRGRKRGRGRPKK